MPTKALPFGARPFARARKDMGMHKGYGIIHNLCFGYASDAQDIASISRFQTRGQGYLTPSPKSSMIYPVRSQE